MIQARKALRYLKQPEEYGVYDTRDIARLGQRNQKLNTLYPLKTEISGSDSAEWQDIARIVLQT